MTELAPNTVAVTTAEEDRTTAGQRQINRIWEYTQAIVTVMITLAAIGLAVAGYESKVIDYGFIAIISTYYARTNHTKVGGIGMKYEGR